MPEDTETNNFNFIKVSPPVIKAVPIEKLQTLKIDGIKLPKSYCDFVSTFGFGLLCDFFYIFVPFEIENIVDRSQELKELILETLESGEMEEFYDITPDEVKYLVPFAISKNGNTFAWKSNEQTGADEYAIYMLDPEMLGVHRAASNLYDFIKGCGNEKVKEILFVSAEPLPMTFEPLSYDD